MVLQDKASLSVGIDLSKLNCPEYLSRNMYTRTGADVTTKCGMGHTNQLFLLWTEKHCSQGKQEGMLC